jgi:hypothetical protein
MIRSKVLSDAAWKEVLAKNKAVKDNGMLKALADIKKLGEDDHDDAQKILDDVVKLTAQLKKSKDAAASPAVTKFLAELSSAADLAMRDIAKAKVEAEKEKKARAEAEAKKQAEKKSGREDDDEEESPALLTTKLIPLLRGVNKGEMMHVLVARAGKQVAVMLSRKPIAAARRKILADELGVSGGVKYFNGHCVKEEGTTTFVMKSEVAGLAKQLKLALLNQTGMRVKRLSCRGEDGDDHDLEEGDDEQIVADAGKDDDGVPAFVPGVDIKERESGGEEPAPSPALASAPLEWDGTREMLQRSINELKRAVQSQIADEGDERVDQINGQLQKLDRILGKLDRRLADSLANAAATRDAAGRREALEESKAILAEYIRYVSSEPLIDHLDRNPFGVKTELKATLSSSLTKLARAIG